MTAEHLASSPRFRLRANPNPFDLDNPPASVDENRESFRFWDYTYVRDRPARLKHIRIYEHCPELADPDALAVIGDALQVSQRASVDEAIRDVGIVGCWRPSTILIPRITEYYANSLLVDVATIAHALWNIDFRRPINRGGQIRIEMFNDENRDRNVRVVMSFVELTYAELRGESNDASIVALTKKVEKLESALATQKAAVEALTVGFAQRVVKGKRED